MPCWNRNRARLESVCFTAEAQLKAMLIRMANATSRFRNAEFDLLCKLVVENIKLVAFIIENVKLDFF